MARVMRQHALLAILALAAGLIVLRSGAAQGELLRVAETFGRLRPEAVLLVLSLTVLSTLISGGMWCRVLTKMGYNVPAGAGLAAFAGSGLACYLVNTAGAAVGGIVCLRRHGVSAGRAVSMTLIANALGLCGVLVWAPFGVLLLARPSMRHVLPLLGTHDLAAAIGTFAGLTLCMAITFWALLSMDGHGGRLMRLLPRRPTAAEAEPSRMPPLRMGPLLTLTPWAALGWFVGTLTLYVLLVALSGSADVRLGDVVGASVLAAAIGSLAFFVPSGMGVRDGALVALLAHATTLDVPTCAAAAITLRALDPLAKFGLLLLVASRVPGGFLAARRVSARVLSDALRPAGSVATSFALARVSLRLSDPLRAVVWVESEYPGDR
jgi:hypothetical protein